MNEQNNLTPKEFELYRSALDEAYPAPKKDIHANVMREIRAERLRQKQRARRAAFVKWGSIAACLAIVCLVGWRVIPETDKFAPMAANKADRVYDLAKEFDVFVCQNSAEENSSYNGYSAEVESPLEYTVDDNSGDYNYGTKGETVPAYSPEAPVATVEDINGESAETEETEETEEEAETVSEEK